MFTDVRNSIPQGHPSVGLINYDIEVLNHFPHDELLQHGGMVG